MMKPVSCVAAGVLAVTVHHAAAAPQYGGMRNGTFDRPQTHKPDEQAVINAVKAGWTLPDDLVWPAHWGPNPSTGNSSSGNTEGVRCGSIRRRNSCFHSLPCGATRFRRLKIPWSR